MIITAKQVNFSDLIGSPEIGRAHKCISASGNYYLVENSKGELDENGAIIEYKVTYDRNGFHCTCKSGENGFANCKKHGVCQHVRISLACEAEIKQAMDDMARMELESRKAEQEAMKKKAAKVRKEELRDANRLYASRERGRMAILDAISMANEIFNR